MFHPHTKQVTHTNMHIQAALLVWIVLLLAGSYGQTVRYIRACGYGCDGTGSVKKNQKGKTSLWMCFVVAVLCLLTRVDATGPPTTTPTAPTTTPTELPTRSPTPLPVRFIRTYGCDGTSQSALGGQCTSPFERCGTITSAPTTSLPTRTPTAQPHVPTAFVPTLSTALPNF